MPKISGLHVVPTELRETFLCLDISHFNSRWNHYAAEVFYAII